ncbi:hypothetical protein K7B10_02835 [Streptomyces flavotricini]|uniref:Uncharacterized protein n=1 Tax=Streptomyces flavotricini TaxID=66888 RepID=A0ABS8DY04_9ACTN|nr:hypothetical protein [Streptomyces flavotricini]MCC0093741.1 hypothetical protein [Streptomyces flavotricini]
MPVADGPVTLRRTARGVSGGGTLSYAWLRELGHLPADAPTTSRFLERVTGQLTCAQLVDRHPLASGPIRALIVDYLAERGAVEETVVERADRVMIFIAVRAFYLDTARWAGEEPGRWGPRVAPCPIKVAGTADRKRLTRTGTD